MSQQPYPRYLYLLDRIRPALSRDYALTFERVAERERIGIP